MYCINIFKNSRFMYIMLRVKLLYFSELINYVLSFLQLTIIIHLFIYNSGLA